MVTVVEHRENEVELPPRDLKRSVGNTLDGALLRSCWYGHGRARTCDPAN